MRTPYQFEILKHANLFKKNMDEIVLFNMLFPKDEYQMRPSARLISMKSSKYNPEAEDAVVIIFGCSKHIHCPHCGNKEAELPFEIHYFINLSELVSYEKAYLARRNTLDNLLSKITIKL